MLTENRLKSYADKYGTVEKDGQSITWIPYQVTLTGDNALIDGYVIMDGEVKKAFVNINIESDFDTDDILYAVYDNLDNIVINDKGGTAQLSITNGGSFTTPEQALEELPLAWDVLVERMADITRELVHWELAPCSELEFLYRYLDLAYEDLIIG